MAAKDNIFSRKQLAFQELFIGSLIYAVVLGFFNDYTPIVYTKSFSSLFFASIVLELLTYLALQLKTVIVQWLKSREGKIYKVATFFCVWFIMFISKFIFIWVLDVLFGSYVRVNGFFGILLVVLCVTIIHRTAYFIFNKLGYGKLIS